MKRIQSKVKKFGLQTGITLTDQKGASLSPTLFVGQQWTSSFLEETRLL